MMTYNVKHRQTDTLYEPMLFEPLKKIIASHALFKVASFVDFAPYLK